MFNLLTQQRAERAIGEAARPIQRIGSRTFMLLLAIELLLMVGVLFWALSWLAPQATPFASTRDIAPIQAAILARLSGETSDPLVDVRGASVRESNLRGFRLDGVTYYYYIEGGANFDPLSRGAVQRADIEVLLQQPHGPKTIVIYRIV